MRNTVTFLEKYMPVSDKTSITPKPNLRLNIEQAALKLRSSSVAANR